MGRRVRERLPVAVGLLLVGVAVAWTAWAYRLDPAERSDELGLPGFVLGLVGVLIPLMAGLRRGRRLTDHRSVDAVATLLAQGVYGQWRKAADERRLVTPAPISIRWSLSKLDVAGPVAAAVGPADGPPAFPPLPDRTAITETDLRAGGGRRELHAVYGGLASGRVVVIGAPGAGKSGTAILLLLDAMAHRDCLDNQERARVPVPVLFTAHGWDPTTTSVRDWLADRLVATYPMFQSASGPAEAATLVAARDKITLILDGLDEIDHALRPAALQALGDAPFRVVVLTRSQEMVTAATGGWLAGAVAVHLHDVTAIEAADYLHRARTGPAPAGWTKLLTDLREHPDGVLARGLSTPLTLTLLRDTYQASDDVSDLLDLTRYHTTTDLERHLLARVLPTAYTPRPGRPAPRYTAEEARRTLTCIARRMGTERDLAWWHVPRWAPATPRILTTALVVGLLGLTIGLASSLQDGLVFGLIGALTSGFTARHGQDEPARLTMANWRAAISRKILGRVFVYGLQGGLSLASLFGLMFWLMDEFASAIRYGFAGALAGGVLLGFAFGLVFGLVFQLLDVLVEVSTADGSPAGPSEVWSKDRMGGIVDGLVFGLVFGSTVGVVFGLVFGVFGLILGLTVVFASYQTWPTTLAWLQLRHSGQVSPAGLMRFLEDARERDVLRTVGAVYQFRHAMLQDQLAAHTTSDSVASAAALRTS